MGSERREMPVGRVYPSGYRVTSEGRAVVDPQALLDSPAVRRVAATAARAVQPPEPAIDPDLLAALRSAFAEGCSTEDLMAGIRQARDASVCRRSPGLCTCGMHVTPAPREWGAEPARPWTFCADALPAGSVPMLYEVATVGDHGPLGVISIEGYYGDGVWSGRRTVYAWRSRADAPPLRPADRDYLATQEVPAEWLGAPEEAP